MNKLCIILPIALLLNAVAPWALTPILMLGGAFLCFEGAEKVWEMVTGKQHSSEEEAGAKDENTLVRGAITTDLILSAEIMVISLNEVADKTIWMEGAVLVAVGIFITAVVYGAVALLVKLDDVGLFYQRKDSDTARAFGAGLVKAMPVVLNAISFIGMLAMLWVGGHIVIGGLDSLNLWHAPHDVIHHLVHSVEHLGGAVAWTTETVGSLIFGLILGFIVVAFIAPFHKKKH